jgi:VanZ family protein
MIKKYKFSIILSAIILYLSLKNSNDLNKVRLFNIPEFDKIVHFLMYFSLMFVIIYESATSSLKKSLFLLALFPFFYGILIEILQGTLTTTRSASVFDAIFNTLGILMAVLIWETIKKMNRKNIR